MTPITRSAPRPSPRVSRRALAGGAAWTAPAVVLAAPTLAQAASSPIDVSVALTSCSKVGSTVTIVYTVCTNGAAAGIGSTFILSGTGSYTGFVSGTLVQNSVFSGTNPWTFTLTAPLAAGSCYGLTITFSFISAGASFTLKTGTIVGNANTVTTNNSATKTISASGGC